MNCSKQAYVNIDILVKYKWRFTFFLSKQGNKQTIKPGNVDVSDISREKITNLNFSCISIFLFKFVQSHAVSFSL